MVDGLKISSISKYFPSYADIPGPQVAQDVLTKDLRPTVPKKTPEAFAELMRRCWDKCPSARPSFNEIISLL